MIGRGRLPFILAALSAALTPEMLSGAEVIPRRPEDYPDPERPTRAKVARKRSRDEKRERAKRLALKKGGIPGAGLWRKCSAANRVRGW